MEEVIVSAELNNSFDSNEKIAITPELEACEAIVGQPNLRFIILLVLISYFEI